MELIEFMVALPILVMIGTVAIIIIGSLWELIKIIFYSCILTPFWMIASIVLIICGIITAQSGEGARAEGLG